MRLNSKKLLFVGAFALMASFSMAQVVEPTDSTKVETGDENVTLTETLIIGKGIIDLEENRKTPVASTVITREEILEKGVGNVEFPEIMKHTPSVYVADQASGFGDGKMFMRGFDQSNTAYLLNGQPINGMDNGSLYWSNWSSLSDIANVIDMQRGLGSSKLAISSVGGTVNIVTRATEQKQGGFVRYIVGNDSYQKQTIGYNTGMKGKWGASFLVDNWSAHRSFARGTEGKGQSYFLSVGYKPSDRHNINFMIFGAPQQHGQNFSKPMETVYEKKNGQSTGVIRTPGYDITGRKGNYNYGFYQGEALSQKTNYYHKPVANINWDWEINNNLSLSTVLYGSIGRGGGTGTLGNGPGYIKDGYSSIDGSTNWDVIHQENQKIKDGISDGNSGTVLNTSVNNHIWYGGVSNLKFDTKTGFVFNLGTDLRFYTGDHYQQLNNLLGAKGRISDNKQRQKNHIVSETYSTNPWSSLFKSASREERIGFDNGEKINYQGAFGQAEYANELFSVFVQGAVSWQQYQKFDRWNYNAEHKDVVSGKVKFKNGTARSSERTEFGYNLKGGFAFNLNTENKVFVNAGKYSRQPYLNNIFVRNTVNYVEPDIQNEEILGFEAGYKYSTRNLKVNVNAYYTKWDHRADTYNASNYPLGGGVVVKNARVLLNDLTQIHKGVEVDFNTKINRSWTLRGFASLGDWSYDGDFNYQVQDTDTQEILKEDKERFGDVKVGNAAQFTFGMGTKVNVTRNFSLDADFNYYAQIHENVNVADLAKARIDGKEYTNKTIAPYATVDAGLSYMFKFGQQSIKFRGNVKNLFNDQYIGRKDNYGYFYGLGRTWNAGVTYNF